MISMAGETSELMGLELDRTLAGQTRTPIPTSNFGIVSAFLVYFFLNFASNRPDNYSMDLVCSNDFMETTTK